MTRQIMGARAGRRVLAPLAATLLLASCSRDTLLEVENPDQITPEVVSSPAGANAQRIAAIGNFATFYAGDVSGSGVGVNLASGLLSDEMVSARGGTEHLDQRDIQPGVFPVTSPWSFAGQAATRIELVDVAAECSSGEQRSRGRRSRDRPRRIDDGRRQLPPRDGALDLGRARDAQRGVLGSTDRSHPWDDVSDPAVPT